MLTLGVETSGSAGSVALVEAGQVLDSATLSQTGRRHARTLVSELQSLFARCGRRPAECDCVAVSIGPGSFTGLRVGVVCAKTVAYAVGCQVVAVDTLEAIAAGAPAGEHQVVALIDAMRGDVFHAHFVRRGDAWVRDVAIRLGPWRELAQQEIPGCALTGPALTAIPVTDWPARRLSPEDWQPTAAAVARIGERQARLGDTTDLWKLEPLYIRKSAAEEQAERAASREQ